MLICAFILYQSKSLFWFHMSWIYIYMILKQEKLLLKMEIKVLCSSSVKSYRLQCFYIFCLCATNFFCNTCTISYFKCFFAVKVYLTEIKMWLSFNRFEIALPHSETELLIPCYLPDKKPVLSLPSLQKHGECCHGKQS
jgi:hypothetical protein